jgi:hypothetical protein
MSKLLLSLKKMFLPYTWWIALLSIIARLRCRFGSRRGEAYSWIWDQDDTIFGLEECQHFLDEHLLPAFEYAVRNALQPYGVDHFLTLIMINTPEGQPMWRIEFNFALDQLDSAKQRISDFLLAQAPISLRKGSQIGFVVSNIAELTLVDFAYERMTLFRTIESSNGG